MKRFFGILLVLLLVMTLIGCQKATAPTLDTTEPPTTEGSSDLSTTLPDERTEEYECVIVDVEDNGGHYCLMTKVTIEYYDGEVVNIFIDEPAVLAFQVPEKYNNGVGIHIQSIRNQIYQRQIKIRRIGKFCSVPKYGCGFQTAVNKEFIYESKL